MGCSCIGISRSSYDYSSVKLPNPNPLKYKILKEEVIYGPGFVPTVLYTILLIEYPDCNNYEGKKILVYTIPRKPLEARNKEVGLDPHFSENKSYHSPIARFEPTDAGWENAILFCQAMKDKEYKGGM